MLSLPEIQTKLLRRANKAMLEQLTEPNEALCYKLKIFSIPNDQIISQLGKINQWIKELKQAGLFQHVEFVNRKIRALGTIQRIPTHLVFDSFTALLLATNCTKRYETIHNNYQLILHSTPELKGIGVTLAQLDRAKLNQLLIFIKWKMQAPNHNILERQHTANGLDTKWPEKNRPLINKCLQHLNNNREDYWQNTGFICASQEVYIDVLCPELREKHCCFKRSKVPLVELHKFQIDGANVLIVENKVTAQSLPDIDNCVMFSELGLSVTAIAPLPIINTANKVLLWSDIDRHGFLILSLARRVMPTTQSFLMTKQSLPSEINSVLESNRFEPGDINFDTILTEEELKTYLSLPDKTRPGHFQRTEQEFISLSYSLPRLKALLAS